LIPNPGFDDIIQCPSDYHQIDLAPPWFKANNGLVDLYNECATIPLFSVPNGGLYIDSYQKQRSGEGYAGIFVFNNDNIVKYGYIETPLLSELMKGQNYYIEFYVSPDLGAAGYWHYTDAVGLALTNSAYYKDIKPHESLPLTPVIENRGTLIKDTIGWTKISGCFTAQGGEKFAIIGNFRNEYETIIEVEDPTVYPYINYFYIEDVLISIFNPLPDTILLCENETVELNAGFLDAIYLWNTNQADSIIVVQNGGKYSVEAFMDNCILTDTVEIIYLERSNNSREDTLICDDESLTLAAPIPGIYLWSTGATSKSITIQTSGIYDVSISNTCGNFVYELDVETENCDCKLYVPNVISINDDGINDNLIISMDCDYSYTILKFQIYNRWGANIYSAAQSNDINWDGKYKEEIVQSGVYAWLLVYEVTRNGTLQHVVLHGDITVLK
jgi:gliding motility-associated-like protein